jgi:nucleotide-binding universal stress UspA family protein
MPEMHAYLGAHGIIAELHRQAGDDRRAGEAILERSQSLGCDTIVMGAYGRYGAREYVFGGATRFLLARATIALLLSH